MACSRYTNGIFAQSSLALSRLRSPTYNAMIWRVVASMAIQLHCLLAFFFTKFTRRVKKLALLSSRNVPSQPWPLTSLVSEHRPNPRVPSPMASRGLGGHRVEEGVKEEPQDDPDGEAHKRPAERQRPVGQNHRGEDHGDHHKTQMENQPFFVQAIEDDRGH